MNRLHGYVMTQESGEGLSNLVVVVSISLREDRIGESGDSGQHLVTQPSRSTITDQAGHFEIKDLELGPAKAGSSAHVMLLVYAPEDVISKDRLEPLSADERLLFRSEGILAPGDHARVIRLHHTQLPTAMNRPSSQSHRSASDLADEIQRSWSESDVLRTRLSDRIPTQVAASTQRRTAARKAVSELSAIPRHLRDGTSPNPLQNNSLLIKNRDDLAKRLVPLQMRSMKEGLRRLSKRKFVPKIRIHLSDAEIKAMGLTIDSHQKVTGQVTNSKIRKHVRANMHGFSLTRVRGMNMLRPEELLKKYRLPDPKKPPNEEKPIPALSPSMPEAK